MAHKKIPTRAFEYQKNPLESIDPGLVFAPWPDIQKSQENIGSTASHPTSLALVPTPNVLYLCVAWSSVVGLLAHLALFAIVRMAAGEAEELGTAHNADFFVWA
ncbi:hypothetical protein HDK77DRAFT_484150 [Phyllosticta capitalensis]|uniref:Uncharacterized protein n=1 Tax=Phyllosticta capitalensis TaxID=121624 RepID=A0ABR1YEF9_9PEZI